VADACWLERKYLSSCIVRFRPAFLLVALLAALPSMAIEVRVEPVAAGPSGEFLVSWDLPPGFEESELLLAVEGGPRVRLTDELWNRNPRVRVVLPALAGMARFVVRAGRDSSGAKLQAEERDIAFSPAFLLPNLTNSGRVPVRSASTRPLPGAEMEWWADRPATPVEGPAPGLRRPDSIGGAGEREGGLALPSPRFEFSRIGSESEARSRTEQICRSLPNRSTELSTVFSGATVPLRN
jgi:hypothetical protein